jgi:O-antigen/teichoic acid export membrane protein
VSSIANPTAPKHTFSAAGAARAAAVHPVPIDNNRLLPEPSAGVLPAATAATTVFGRFRRIFVGRGLWALSDQAILSLGNFLTNFLLFNYLPSRGEYAVYALILGSIFFLNTLHASLVSYPLSLMGAATDEEGLRPLTRRCARVTGLLLIPLGLILVCAVCALGQPALIPWALAAMLLWQLQETLRRAMMSQLKHRWAMPGDAVSYLGQAAVIGMLAAFGALTLKSALVAVALTSGGAALLQALQLRLFRLPQQTSSRTPVLRLAVEHWTFGRWLVAINLISIITVQAMPWTLKFMRGAQGDVEVAHFQALATLLGVINPVAISVAGLIVPAAAIAYRSGGVAGARKVALEYGLLGAVLLLPYFALLAIFPEAILHLYTQGQHESFDGLPTALRLFVAAYALTYPTQVIAALLNGLGHARSALVAQVAFAGATLAISLPLAARFGLMGAVWGGLIPPVAFGAVSLFLLARVRSANALEGKRGRVVSSLAGADGMPLREGSAQ